MSKDDKTIKRFSAYESKGYASFSSLGRLGSKADRPKLTGDYTKEEVLEWFKDPDKNEAKLREMSSYLYIAKGMYYSIINFYANLPTLDYIITPTFSDFTDKDKILKQKQKVKDYGNDVLDKSNIRKWLKAILKDSCYYGYERKDRGSFYMQRLNNAHCRQGKLINGLPTIEFDFSYFDKDDTKLELYPAEFSTIYKQYTGKGKEKGIKWRELDYKSTMCIPLESEDYNFPALTGIFDDILDLDDFYEYLKDTTELDTTKMVVQKVPLDEENGTPLADPSDIQFFQNAIASILDERFKVVSTPFDITVENFAQNKMTTTGSDGVKEIKNQTLNDAGVAPSILGEADNMSGLQTNVEVNAGYVFAILEKIEAWLRHRMKRLCSNKHGFKIEFLRTTNLNRSDAFDAFKSLVDIGGAVTPLISAAGINPESYFALLELENLEERKDLFELLESVYTQSADSTDATPVTTDTGETSADSESNDNR